MSNPSSFVETLRVIGEKFECDKVIPHDYHLYYAAHLEKYLDRPFKLLEIGIGGEGRESGGASIKLWEEAFPTADILALDIYDKSEFDSSRIKTFIVDQGDAVAVKAFADAYGPFDVIIDDGSHKRSDQLTSLFNLIDHVVPGGYYILEDYFTSYWPVYDGSTLAKDFLDTPVRWLKQSIDVINRNNMLSEETKALLPDWNIDELHVYPGISFLRKAMQPVRSEIPNEEFLANQIELDNLRYGKFNQLFMNYAKDPLSNLELFKSLRSQIDSLIDTVEPKS
jgi:hypothetical protein